VLQAGKLRHRVHFQRQVRQQDPTTGDIRTVWANLFTSVPAAIEPLSVREYIAAQSVQSEVVARITVRYREGLAATQRIVHGKKIYNPSGVLPDKDSGLEFVTIPCSEGVNEGA
jgi:SPP1 family predicted phage head-tail adaptor